MTLQVTPSGLFCSSYAVRNGDKVVAQVKDSSLWGFRGEIRIGEQTYRARRERGVCLLETGGTVLARAVRPRQFHRTMQFEHAGRTYELRARSSMGRAFDLLDAQAVVGGICPEGVFSRRANVDLPAALPAWLQMFVIWLVMSSWKETETAGVLAGAAVAASSG